MSTTVSFVGSGGVIVPISCKVVPGLLVERGHVVSIVHVPDGPSDSCTGRVDRGGTGGTPIRTEGPWTSSGSGYMVTTEDL